MTEYQAEFVPDPSDEEVANLDDEKLTASAREALGLALKGLPSSGEKKLLPRFSGPNREAQILAYKGSLEELAGNPEGALNLYQQALEAFNVADVSISDLFTATRSSVAMAASIERLGGDLTQALHRVSEVCLKQVNFESLRTMAVAKSGTKSVGDKRTSYASVPENPEGLAKKFPMPINEYRGGTGPQINEGAYWIREALSKMIPRATEGLSQAAILAYKNDLSELSEELLMQARVLAQYDSLNIEQAATGQWSYDPNHVLSSEAAGYVADALRKMDRMRESLEVQVSSGTDHNHGYVDLAYFCDSIVDFIIASPANKDTIDLVNKALRRLNFHTSDLDYQTVHGGKLRIAAALTKKFNLPRETEDGIDLIEPSDE